MQHEWVVLVLFQFLYKNTAWIISQTNRIPFFLDTDICRTKICEKDAENLLSSLNQSVDPCSDFYEFACGGWISKNKRPSSEPTWSQWEPVYHKVEEQIRNILENNRTENEINALTTAKQMFQACLHIGKTGTENAFELNKLLTKYGGWPIITENWSNSNSSWHDTVAKISSELNIHPLLKFHVSLNLYNTSEHILYIDQPSLIFPHWILSNPLSYESQIKAYEQWIISSAIEIAIENKIKISNKNIKQEARQIVDFEIELANLISTKDTHNVTNVYKIMSLNQLQLWMGIVTLKRNKNLLWSEIMKTLFENNKIPKRYWENVIVKDIKYLLKLIQLIENTPKKIVANYVSWSIVKYFSKDTSYNLQKYSFLIDNILFGVDDSMPRKQQCIIKIKKQMNFAIGFEYVNRYLDDFTKKDIETIIQSIKSVLVHKLKSLNWLDDTTREKALEKAHAISNLVAYPEYLRNTSYIEEYYKNLEVSNNNIKNIIAWNRFSRQKEFSKLLLSVDSKSWSTNALDVNAYYSVLQNAVIIPAGLLQYPFYTVKRLRELNYGAIGTIIGHEFSHAFDNTGRQADKDGNIKQWWTKESVIKYEESLKCFEEHYNKYIVEILHKTMNKTVRIQINGHKTQDENIADIIGLELAYEAYKQTQQSEFNTKLYGLEAFSSDQLFFLSFANQWCELSTSEQLLSEIVDGDHTPNKIRILGVLSNSDAFSEAFQCEEDSPMNSRKKCKLW